MLRKRSEIFKDFKEYKAKVESLTGHQIKKIRTDNAKEYLSREFINFLKNEGITRQLSVEYTPQQNGVEERTNRTFVEMVRCMLLQAQVPYSLWAEAINTATYIRNCYPTKALDNKTPHEKWTENKQYIGYLRVLGSRVIALQKRYQQNKFTLKRKEYLLVGYSKEAKVYRLWEKGTKTIEKYKDVRLLEDETPYIQEGKEETLCEIPLDIQKKGVQNQTLTEIEEIMIQTEDNIKQEQDNNFSNSDTEEEIYGTSIEIAHGTRLRGRPSLLRNGKPGRPRKLFHYANKASNKDSVPNEVREAINSAEKKL